RAHHFAAKSRANRLMSQADSKQWHFAREVTNQFDADPSVLRSARPGRNDDTFRPHRVDLANANLVIATHLDRSAQFAQVLDKVVGKRVVVVANEDHDAIVAVETRESQVSRFQSFNVSRSTKTIHDSDRGELLLSH